MLCISSHSTWATRCPNRGPKLASVTSIEKSPDGSLGFSRSMHCRYLDAPYRPQSHSPEYTTLSEYSACLPLFQRETGL